MSLQKIKNKSIIHVGSFEDSFTNLQNLSNQDHQIHTLKSSKMRSESK